MLMTAGVLLEAPFSDSAKQRWINEGGRQRRTQSQIKICESPKSCDISCSLLRYIQPDDRQLLILMLVDFIETAAGSVSGLCCFHNVQLQDLFPSLRIHLLHQPPSLSNLILLSLSLSTHLNEVHGPISMVLA